MLFYRVFFVMNLLKQISFYLDDLLSVYSGMWYSRSKCAFMLFLLDVLLRKIELIIMHTYPTSEYLTHLVQKGSPHPHSLNLMAKLMMAS